MNLLAGIIASLREFAFPAGCALCCGPLLDGAECRAGLCADCASRLIPESCARCPRCGKPLISERDLCGECRGRPAPAFDAAKALFRYGGPARALLVSYKFGTGRAASAFLAGLFREEVLAMAAEAPIVVPVPPRPGKLKRNGWDQVERLARDLERSGVAVERCLRRLPSRSQKELDRRGRATNLVGKMVCVAGPPRVALLLDDVITTGATLDACARALKESGSEKVYALTFCYD